jgi:hypothetical protein
MYAKAKTKTKFFWWWQLITGTWTYTETSWRPSIFPWAAHKQRPAHESEARTSEHNPHPFSILDRCGPSAKHDAAVHGSHFVLLVWDRIEVVKLLWHCWQEIREPLIQLALFEALPTSHRPRRPAERANV